MDSTHMLLRWLRPGRAWGIIFVLKRGEPGM